MVMPLYGDPLTSNNIVTGKPNPSGAPEFRGDPLTYNNCVSGTSDNLSASTVLCGVNVAQS